MAAVSKHEYLAQASGEREAEETAAAVAAHADEGQAVPAPPRAAARRPWSARAGSRPARGQPPEAHLDIRDLGFNDPDPGHGQPHAPDFPQPLPGSHHYAGKEIIPERQALDVGPAKPYYSGFMAHGVQAPPEHGGRPAPRAEDRHEIEATREELRELERIPVDPVPVYVVEKAGGTHPLLRAAFRRVKINAPGGDPVLLIGKDPKRTSVRILNEGLVIPTLTGEGQVTDPAAGTVIAQITAAALAAAAPPGTVWQIAWTVSLQGTVTAADANNMQLVSFTVATIEQGVFPGVVGNYPQNPAQAAIPAGIPIAVAAIANASGASAIYAAQITATPVLANNQLRIHSEPGGLPGGALLPAGMTNYLEIDTQDEIWAISDPGGGPSPSFISVISQYDVPAGA